MKDKLIIFKLGVKSSYIQNIEVKADKLHDTLQFYVHDESIWRIKTFAIDHDIHIYKVNLGNRSLDETLEFLIKSTHDHYGDILNKMFDFKLVNPNDIETALSFFKLNNLNPKIESTHDFAFWNPDNGKYQTQSRPL